MIDTYALNLFIESKQTHRIDGLQKNIAGRLCSLINTYSHAYVASVEHEFVNEPITYTLIFMETKNHDREIWRYSTTDKSLADKIVNTITATTTLTVTVINKQKYKPQ